MTYNAFGGTLNPVQPTTAKPSRRGRPLEHSPLGYRYLIIS